MKSQISFFKFFLAFLLVEPARLITGQDSTNEQVILLHGLSRTARSMDKLKAHLEKKNFQVYNLNYPSRKFKIEILSEMVWEQIQELDLPKSTNKIHFVTHSMGGILVRQMLKSHELLTLGRVVMLSPPNKGSEIVDKLGGNPLFEMINGPASIQLGTHSQGFVSKLGKVEFDLGVITGDRSINLYLSSLIPGKDDGKVSVKRAKIEGMKDFFLCPVAHPFIMNDQSVLRQTEAFLLHGKFQRP